MRKCYVCDVSEEKAFLYDGISKEGFVNICRSCYLKNEIPLVEKKTVGEGFEKRVSVRERLMNISGVRRPEIESSKPEKPKLVQKEEVTLNKLIEQNFKKNISEEIREYDDLVENFHWIIMRRRRSLKLTQEEFAKAIFEPIIVVEHLEKKILPKDYVSLIKKTQNFLSINLFKGENILRFDPNSLASESKISSGLTISDLKGLHEQKVGFPQINPEELNLDKIEELVGRPVEEDTGVKRNWLGMKKKVKSEDVSQEDIDDILFRRGE